MVVEDGVGVGVGAVEFAVVLVVFLVDATALVVFVVDFNAVEFDDDVEACEA